MKKVSAIVLGAALFVGAIENPAHSAQPAIYAASPNDWEIRVDRVLDYCFAWKSFGNEKYLAFAVMPNMTASFVVDAPNFAKPGHPYLTGFGASNGTYGELLGVGMVNGVGYPEINGAQLLALLSPYVILDGIGAFNMSGATEAVGKATECALTLNGRGEPL